MSCVARGVSGLLSTGYVLVLPWKVWPNNDKVRVVAQLRLPDGRLFEADKDVTVHVVPAEKRPPPTEAPLLPPPHPLDPPAGGPDLTVPAPDLAGEEHRLEPLGRSAARGDSAPGRTAAATAVNAPQRSG